MFLLILAGGGQTVKRLPLATALILAVAILLCPAYAETPQSTHPMFHVEVKGHGTPMILIPGLSSSGATWDSTVAHYENRYECHVLTLAGFAGQPPEPGFSLEKVRDQISSYIAANHLAPAVVVGHSLGGDLALWLAAAHPDQVRKLVIVDSLPALGAAADPNTTSSQLRTIAEQIRQSMMHMTEAERAKMGKQSISGMATSPKDVELIESWSRATDPRTEADALGDLMALDLRDKVADIKSPTLVLGTWVGLAAYATKDQILATFEAQYQKLKGAKIELAPKARHFIMFDDPQWMFAEMDEFLGYAKQ